LIVFAGGVINVSGDKQMAIETGRRTLYELAAENGDQRYLIMYTSNKSRRMLLDCAREHGERLVPLTGHENIVFAKRAADGATMGEWRIRWTGRTQREAVSSKLPWIGDLKELEAAHA
jgi:hypothetical protein